MSLDYSLLATATIHPAFLETNASTYQYPFSAIAEIVDNSKDADAKNLEIDFEKFVDDVGKTYESFTFLDDGVGMDRDEVKKIIFFGHSKKTTQDGKIGMYGNGLKAGSMRLASSCLLLSKKNDVYSALLLSNGFVKSCSLKEVIVPLPSFFVNTMEPYGDERNIHDIEMTVIYCWSPFKSKEALAEQFARIKGVSGTLVILFGLRHSEHSQFELDFETDKNDILWWDNNELPDNLSEKNSLRKYLEILYYHPTMGISLRKEPLMLKRIVSSLCHAVTYELEPLTREQQENPKSNFLLSLGLNVHNRSKIGLCIYANGRLILPYLKVGCQIRNQQKYLGILGIVNMSYSIIHPNQNKQAIIERIENPLLQMINSYMAYYYESIISPLNWSWSKFSYRSLNPKEKPTINEDFYNVINEEMGLTLQCCRCKKWRKTKCDSVPKDITNWSCSQHPDPDFNCELMENPEELNPPVKSNFSKKMLNEAMRKDFEEYQRLREGNRSSELIPIRRKSNGSVSIQKKKIYQMKEGVDQDILPQRATTSRNSTCFTSVSLSKTSFSKLVSKNCSSTHDTSVGKDHKDLLNFSDSSDDEEIRPQCSKEDVMIIDPNEGSEDVQVLIVSSSNTKQRIAKNSLLDVPLPDLIVENTGYTDSRKLMDDIKSLMKNMIDQGAIPCGFKKEDFERQGLGCWTEWIAKIKEEMANEKDYQDKDEGSNESANVGKGKLKLELEEIDD